MAEEVPDTPDLSQHQAWINNPNGGSVFVEQREAIKDHDPKCHSLQHAWHPRIGGVTCVSDLAPDCDGGCGLMFFWEGAVEKFEDCENSGHWYCGCCAAKATHCPCTNPQKENR